MKTSATGFDFETVIYRLAGVLISAAFKLLEVLADLFCVLIDNWRGYATCHALAY